MIMQKSSEISPIFGEQTRVILTGRSSSKRRMFECLNGLKHRLVRNRIVQRVRVGAPRFHYSPPPPPPRALSCLKYARGPNSTSTLFLSILRPQSQRQLTPSAYPRVESPAQGQEVLLSVVAVTCERGRGVQGNNRKQG